MKKYTYYVCQPPLSETERMRAWEECSKNGGGSECDKYLWWETDKLPICWTIDGGNYFIILKNGERRGDQYEMDFFDRPEKKMLLRWIKQIQEKSWVTMDDIHAVCECFNEMVQHYWLNNRLIDHRKA